MKTAIVTLKSVTPYSQSRAHETPKFEKELPDAYEERTWREKAHFDENRQVFIPPMAIKNALDAAAKFLSEKIPGKKNETFTKHFKSGVIVTDQIFIGITKDKMLRGRYYCNADGIRGSGKRVWRIFPEVHKWEGNVTLYSLDDLLTKEVFLRYLQAAGSFIGIGRFRPENGGFFGRFSVLDFQWNDHR